MFRLDSYAGKFSKYDDQGFPTHDHEGAEVSKSARKKLEKEYEKQQKLHEEYLREVSQTQ